MDRSENMRAIRSTGMRPELEVRSLVHRLGFRFGLHRDDLPGRPDLVFGSRRKVIFVHGCFWHSHKCRMAHTPKSNLNYWLPKLARNKQRDKRNIVALEALGWRSLVIWECETSEERDLKKRVRAFLGRPKRTGRV